MVTLTEGAVKWLIAKVKATAATAAGKKYKNIQIPVSAWREEESENGYHYAADIQAYGVTADDVPLVMFSGDTGGLETMCVSGADKVTVYADAIPNYIVTVQSIITL